MEKAKYIKLIDTEVYGNSSREGLTKAFARLYRRRMYPPTHSVYLFRKMQYFGEKSDFLSQLRYLYLRKKLATTYGIIADKGSKIGPGLKFAHPTSIVIGAHVVAGENLTLYQNTTLGERESETLKLETSQQ